MKRLKTVTGFILVILVCLLILFVTFSKLYSDALFTTLKKSTDFTISNYENLNGNISVDLVVQDDPGWLREDFIKLEAKILLQEYKLFPRKDANEFKGIQIRFFTKSKPVREIALIKVSEQTAQKYDWHTMDVDKVQDNVDSYSYFLTATDPVELVRADYLSWLNEDYTISMRVLLAEVDDSETQRQIDNYKGSDLAASRGWTNAFLDQHFVVVKVMYECEFDHTKTSMDDGILVGYVYLTRDPQSSIWTIVDRTSPSETT